MNVEKLRVLFEASSSKYADCEAMGTSYQNMYNIVYNGRACRVDLLERIARFYEVPVGYFFDEGKEEASTSPCDSTELVRLRAMVEAYEKAFSLLGRSKKP